jgi:hypothetical protein
MHLDAGCSNSVSCYGKGTDSVVSATSPCWVTVPAESNGKERSLRGGFWRELVNLARVMA